MASPKLNFYIGKTTEGAKDGEKASSVNCTFPLVYAQTIGTNYGNPCYSSKNMIMRITLRCDEGYRAEKVNINFVEENTNGKILYIPFYHLINKGSYDYYSASDQTISVGNVSDVNKSVYITLPVVNGATLKCYASYSEVKV